MKALCPLCKQLRGVHMNHRGRPMWINSHTCFRRRVLSVYRRRGRHKGWRFGFVRGHMVLG